MKPAPKSNQVHRCLNADTAKNQSNDAKHKLGETSVPTGKKNRPEPSDVLGNRTFSSMHGKRIMHSEEEIASTQSVK